MEMKIKSLTCVINFSLLARASAEANDKTIYLTFDDV